MQQPMPGQAQFMAPVQVPLPRVIRPLRYCDFRSASQGEYGEMPEVTDCAVFASEEIDTMSFCFQHGQVIQAALVQEESHVGH